MQRTVVGAVAAAMALGAVGCGGSGETQLTRQQFARKADAICKQGEERRAALLRTRPLSPDVGKMQVAYLASIRHQVAQLESFDAPKAASAAFEQYKHLLLERRLIIAQRIRDAENIKNQNSHTPGTELHEIEMREGATMVQGARLAQQMGLAVCH